MNKEMYQVKDFLVIDRHDVVIINEFLKSIKENFVDIKFTRNGSVAWVIYKTTEESE